MLFLRYEALEDAWPAVRDFLGLPVDLPCLTIRARDSEWQLLPADERERLEAMYGTLARELAALPAVEAR